MDDTKKSPPAETPPPKLKISAQEAYCAVCNTPLDPEGDWMLMASQTEIYLTHNDCVTADTSHWELVYPWEARA